MKKICKFCNKQFVKIANAQRYCSKECYKEVNKESSKKYRNLHKEEGKKWREENKVEVNKSNREYLRKRMKDPIFRLNHNISGGIYKSLRFKGLSKAGRHWENLVGYTTKQLKSHLENLFTKGMTWSNHSLSGWHMDHITPIDFFEYTSINDVEFKYCWSLDNLQPLWAEDNLSKSNSLL